MAATTYKKYYKITENSFSLHLALSLSFTQNGHTDTDLLSKVLSIFFFVLLSFFLSLSLSHVFRNNLCHNSLSFLTLSLSLSLNRFSLFRLVSSWCNAVGLQLDDSAIE